MTEENEDVYVYGYARVSTQDQDLEAQTTNIRKYCKMKDWYLMNLFEDKASGKDTKRAGFQAMMEAIDNSPYPINAVVIYKLDRIGRSVKDLIEISEHLKGKGVGFVSITDSIDTTTPQGRLFFHLLGAIAEYERSLILERTELGKQLARQKGVKFGRKKITETKEIDMGIIIKKIDVFGVPKSKIAKEHGISRSTLYKLINEYRHQKEEELLSP